MNLDDPAALRRIDQGDFAGLIEQLPQQLIWGEEITSKVSLPKWKASGFSNLVVVGMGGSAIAAEIAKSFLSSELKIPFHIVRNYQLPEFVNQKTLLIVSSYSGNTEETLSAYAQGRKHKAKIVGIASGGKLASLCQKHRIPLVTLPTGYPPRAAVGYSLAVILTLLGRLNLVNPKSKELNRTASFLNSLSQEHSANRLTDDNPAKLLAAKLSGKVPVIYAGEDYFFSVAVRWKQQICENAKTPAFCNVFPEFNHNELVGWSDNFPLKEKLVVIVLRDKQDHRRIQARMEIVKGILKEKQIEVMEVESTGKTLLERMLSLVLLGDWVSYYLAILNEVDPTSIEVIDYLKRSLEQVR